MYPAFHFEGRNAHKAVEITVTFEALKIDVVDIAGMTTVMKLYWVLDIIYIGYPEKTLELAEIDERLKGKLHELNLWSTA